MFSTAVNDRYSTFRIPVFICGEQDDFDGRIVVLRKENETNNLVQYHSDIRSDKIAKLKANKNAAMLFYVAPRWRGLRSVYKKRKTASEPIVDS